MDKRKSFINVAVAMTFKVILLVSSVLVKRYVILYIGNDLNGLNSLYLSIINVLAVTELGVGDAIIFCMYQPIAEGNIEKTASLYVLFKKIYTVVGIVIAALGCLCMPFLPYLARGYVKSGVNLYQTFVLMLISVVLTYFFNAKTSLMNAYRDNYITTTITSGGQLLQQILQIFVIYKTRSFTYFLMCRIVAVSVQWMMTEIIMHRKYTFILKARHSGIDEKTRVDVIKNTKAMFMHRIGTVLVNTFDSIVISSFIGIAILGRYSNYTGIVTAMLGLLVLFFSPLTSTIGQLFVVDKKVSKQYYDFFCAVNFLIGCIFFLGYYSVIDDLIIFLFGTGMELDKKVSFVITVNYFIQFMRQATLLFRDATGTFYHDRWKPVAEGVINFILSVIFVKVCQMYVNEEIAVVGVIIATIITNILICHLVEPYVLYKHAFHMPVIRHYIRNYGQILLFLMLLFGLNLCMVSMENKKLEFLINGCMAVCFSIIPIAAVLVKDKNFRCYMKKMILKVRRKSRK